MSRKHEPLKVCIIHLIYLDSDSGVEVGTLVVHKLLPRSRIFFFFFVFHFKVTTKVCKILVSLYRSKISSVLSAARFPGQDQYSSS